MRKQIIGGYLTLPSYISSPLISTAELFWHNLPAAEVEGLDCCVNRDPGPGSQGGRAPAHNRQEANEEFSSFHPDSAGSVGTIASLILQ